MKKIFGLIKYHFLVLLREPITMFLSVSLPFVLLFLQQTGMRETLADGTSVMDLAIPTFIIMAVMTLCILDLGYSHAYARQTKFLRRLRMTPMTTTNYILSGIVARLVVLTIFVITLFIVSHIAFDVSLVGRNWLLITSILLLVFAMFYFIGMFFANIMPTGKASQSICNAAYFTLLFLGGIFVSIEAMPAVARPIAENLPTARAIELLNATWNGTDILVGNHLLIVSVITILFAIASIKFFKYE